jgi:signal transduction histidine kinase
MRTGESRYGSAAVLAVPSVRKDGTRISVEFTIVPFHDNGGGMMGIAAVMRDVTKQFEETRALRKAVAAKHPQALETAGLASSACLLTNGDGSA